MSLGCAGVGVRVCLSAVPVWECVCLSAVQVWECLCGSRLCRCGSACVALGCAGVGVPVCVWSTASAPTTRALPSPCLTGCCAMKLMHQGVMVLERLSRENRPQWSIKKDDFMAT